MTRRSTVVAALSGLLVFAGLALRAVTVHSVGSQPLLYRITARGNDLDSVEGLAPPGRVVELWFRQRNFREGGPSGSDLFGWCGWKNRGEPILIGRVAADTQGVFRFVDLAAAGTTVGLFPPVGDADGCRGGLLTQLLPRVCDGTGCSPFAPPTVHWLNLNRRNDGKIATAAAAISGAERAALAIADGPNDGPEQSSVYDVDQSLIDTRASGLQPGQLVTWKCGPGGTASCPSTVIHDASTVIAPDPEFGYLLATLHGHAAGGSVIATAAIPRPEGSLGFQVDIDVTFRGALDINLGCDRATPFDFRVPPRP